MSDRKPFWSSVPGVATGVAGIVSAIVGLLGVSVQLGWIGGDNGTDAASSSDGVSVTTASTAFGSTATTARTSPAVTTRPGEYEVEPSSIEFEPLKPREAVVKVKNTGDVPLTMSAPTVRGSAAANFDADDLTCTESTLGPGLSCEIKVTFTATQPGEYAAALVVAAANVPKAVEVELTGTRTLLG
jgi:hypothetical protein